MTEFSDRLQLTLQEYYKLECYRFNLVQFTITRDFIEASDEQRHKILEEIDDMHLLVGLLDRLLITDYRKGKRVVVWSNESNPLGYDFIYEFSSVETASVVTGITEFVIRTLCKDPGQNASKGYSFAYKEDFDLVVKDVKF